VVSEQEIEDSKTARGSWTRAQLESWGVAWPPKAGWKERLTRGERDFDPVDKPAQPHPGPTLQNVALRDWFAGLAMQACLKHASIVTPEKIAAASYEFADAMMKARETR
jgi:hypothetical protein